MEPGHTDVTTPAGLSSDTIVEHALDRCTAVGNILARIGDKWSVLVVMSLGDRTLRFNELKRYIDGISQRMLTLTLRGLERDGLVERTFFPTIPPKVTYALTDLGRSLRDPIGALGQWAVDHRTAIERCREGYDRRNTTIPPQEQKAV